MTKIHLVIPCSGGGSRFLNNGFNTPKPLIKIHNKPFLYWATKSILNFVSVKDLTFVVLQEHVDKFHIDQEILKYFQDAKIVVIPHVLNGAVLTCLKAVETIDDNFPIIFNDCDHLFCCQEFNQFCEKKDFSSLDGALLTFTSTDPKYSFIQLDQNNNVIRTVEKQAISDKAICGAYYFKNKEIFLENVKEYLDKCNYQEYFVSGVYNIMADHNLKIKNFNCDYHLSFGTPEEYQEAKKSSYFERLDS